MIPALHIAAAPRQVDAVRCLRDAVMAAAPSVQILDWTERELPPSRSALPGAMALRKRNRTLDRHFFSFCADACMSADLVVCLGIGQETVIQAGMAYMAGIPVLGIRDQQTEPGFMMESCVSRWVDDMADVPPLVARLQHCLSRIETYSPEADMACPDCDLKSICRYFSLLADEDKRKV